MRNDFELPSAYTRQTELFPGTWIDDGSADGLYCKKYPQPFTERMYEEIDKNREKREGAKNFREIEKLDNEFILNQSLAMMNSARLRKKSKREIPWRDNDDYDIHYCCEADGKVRHPFYWLGRITLEHRARIDPEFREELDRGEWD